MRSRRKYNWIFVIIYTACILYITLFSRTPSLSHIVRPTPLWSYIRWLEGNGSSGRSILLNIVLFIPIGFFLGSVFKRRYIAILACLALASAIEAIQFATYLGFFDVDDIISNLIGGAIGAVLYNLIEEKNWSVAVSILLLCAGLGGCIITSQNIQTYETQFDFDIESVNLEGDRITLEGICRIYNRGSLNYQILLGNGDKTYPADTRIDGDHFKATAVVDGEDFKVEIQFQGYKPIATSTFINGETVLYVNKAFDPQIEGTDLKSIIDPATLKVYNPEHDVYVYQLGDRLYWLIGKDSEASIIYHLYTDELENLPENRKQYGFDNRGFRFGSNKEITETMNCGQYRVFSDIIPPEYHVSAIMVGMNKGQDVLWKQFFRPTRF